jgi:hypothetical protein
MDIVREVSRNGPVQNGVLSATSLVLTMNGHPLPCTVTLASTSGTRAIQLSTDNGVNYFLPTYDATVTNMINVSVRSPITNVQLTGSIGDIWSVR